MRKKLRAQKAVETGTIVLLLSLLLFWLKRPGLEGDTVRMAASLERAYQHCLVGHQFPCPQLGQHSLGQIAWGWAAFMIGRTAGFALHALVYLNLFLNFLFAVIAFRTLKLRNGVQSAVLFACFALSGYWMRYFASSFSEAFGMGAIGFLTLTLLHERAVPTRNVYLVLTACAAASYKEIGPVLVPLWVSILTIVLRLKGGLRSAVPAYLGVFIAMLANLGLNLLRYGGMRNAAYVGSENFALNSATVAESWVGLWFDQKGALLWFAFPLIISLIALLTAGSKGRRVAIALFAMLGVLTSGFSLMSYPFGRVAWGPRYFVPWLPSILFVAFWVMEVRWPRSWATLGPWLRGVLFFAFCLLAFVQFRAFFQYSWVARLEFEFNSWTAMLMPQGSWRDYFGAAASVGLLSFWLKQVMGDRVWGR